MKINLYLLTVTFLVSCNLITIPEKETESKIRTEIYENPENRKMLDQAGEGNILPTAYLNGRDDQTINIDSYRGKPLFLNFWAQWCKPCLNDTPNFQEATKKYPNANFISISIDLDKEDWKSFLQENNWTGNHFWMGRDKSNPLYALLYSHIDSDEITGVHISLPKYIFISAKGEIMEKRVPSPSSTKFLNRLEELMN